MQKVRLGRTGLEVSVAGLGAGGSSRLGMRGGASEAEAAALVRAAVDLGVTFIDTAAAYGTEGAVGLGLSGIRDQVVISTKASIAPQGAAFGSDELVGPLVVRQSVENSLKALRTDYVDILHLHGVRPHQYQYCRDQILPELKKLRAEGKIRFLGVTEGFGVDRDHAMALEAVRDGDWDVIMLGMNFVNPSASKALLPAAITADIGTLCMYAVRGALAKRDTLIPLIEKLVESGEIDAAALAADDPIGFLVEPNVAKSLTEAAYRFCRHTDGLHVILTGTGNVDHLKSNVAAIEGPSLPAEVLAKLAAMFGRVTSATGDLPRAAH